MDGLFKYWGKEVEEVKAFSKDLFETGSNIAEKRSEKKYSQEKFAEKIGISRTALGNIERGTSSTGVEVLCSICRSLDVSPNEILPLDLKGGMESRNVDSKMNEIAKRIDGLSLERKNKFYEMAEIILIGLENG